MQTGSRRLMGLVGVVVGALAIVWATPRSSAGDCGVEKLNLKAAAAQSGLLNQMIAVTKLAGLDETDPGIGPLTLFAPSDAAFAALPENLRNKLLAPENRGQLAIVLMHHAVPGEFPTARLLKASAKHYAVDAVDGTLLEITTRHGINVAGASIVKADIVATDGIIHIIDKVLIPKSVLAELEAGPDVTTIAAGLPAVE